MPWPPPLAKDHASPTLLSPSLGFLSSFLSAPSFVVLWPGVELALPRILDSFLSPHFKQSWNDEVSIPILPPSRSSYSGSSGDLLSTLVLLFISCLPVGLVGIAARVLYVGLFPDYLGASQRVCLAPVFPPVYQRNSRHSLPDFGVFFFRVVRPLWRL